MKIIIKNHANVSINFVNYPYIAVALLNYLHHPSKCVRICLTILLISLYMP